MIKISLLCSLLHESATFTLENKEFIERIEKELGEKITLSKLDDHDCDLKLIFIASGGSEGIFLDNLNKLKPPYYLLTSGANNSLAASLEILTYLNLNNLSGEVLHGDAFYIASRIKELLNAKNKELERLGVIGAPSDWLISSIPSVKTIDKFGIGFVDISLDEVLDIYNKLNDSEISFKEQFDKAELKKANKMYYALKEIIKKYDLVGLTIRCFDLLTSIKTTSCLALALLNEEGFIATCEGDIASMISMYLIKKHFNQSSFQANPARIDVKNKKMVLCHCTLPLDMVTSYKFDTHFESGIGVAIKGELKEEDVTIFRLSSNLHDYFIAEGRIIRNLNEVSLCRSQIEVEFCDDISSLLKKPCGNHHIVFYGKHKDELIEILEKEAN